MVETKRRWSPKMGRWLAATLLVVGAVVAPTATATAVEAGDEVFIGSGEGYGGTRVFPIWYGEPGVGEPDAWAYCIEHDVSARTNVTGVVGDFDEYLGDNHVLDAGILGKVHWVLEHSYPAVTLAELEAAAGITSLSANDAIEATQYAIWRYTDLTWDAEWEWATSNSEAVYWYLVDGANANAGPAPVASEVTVSVDAPTGAHAGDSLVGPFVVHTNQPSVSVAAGGYTLTDAAGNAIDAAAVIDGQEVFIDLRGVLTAGSATVTAAAAAAGAVGNIISVPAQGNTEPTAGAHAQTIILVQASTSKKDASADVSWTAVPTAETPVIGTSLVDSADGDRVLPWNGGTVVDTVAYQNLVPGTEYTIAGELMNKADGLGTGITSEVTFTPTEANGSVGLSFVVPAGFDGGTLVAFEWLFEGAVAGDRDDAVAEHTDIDDAAQTVTVEKAPVVEPETPVIGTSLVDSADGDRVLPWNGGTVVDTVAYQNLVPGTEYTIAGELMNKADGLGTGITSEVTFTPTEANGSVGLSFVVPAGFDGGTLVAFEWLFEGAVAGDRDDAVAEHTDIDDAAQTVTVEKAPVVEPTPEPTPVTPEPNPTPTTDKPGLAHTGTDLPLWGAGIASLLLAMGLVVMAGRKRRVAS